MKILSFPPIKLCITPVVIRLLLFIASSALSEEEVSITLPSDPHWNISISLLLLGLAWQGWLDNPAASKAIKRLHLVLFSLSLWGIWL